MIQNRSPNLPYIIHAVVVLAVLVWTCSHLFPPINLDVGAMLYVAKRWLEGDRLYVDVIDPNTPWAVALHVPAEFTAELLGLDGPTWFSLYVTLAVGIAVWLVWRLAQQHEDLLGPLTARTLPLAAGFALGVDPGRCFGQREHLLVIAAAPYLVLSALRAAGVVVPRWQRIALGLIAGLGFAIKPHFVLPWLGIEAYVLWVRGFRVSLRDLVPWIVVAVLTAHLLFALLVTPEYIDVIVPFAAEAYTSPAHALERAGQILIGLELGPVTALLPILAAIAIATRVHLTRLLCVFVGCAAVVSAVQGKGWDYHSIPALDATILLIVVTLTQLIERHALASDRLTQPASTLLSACLLVPFLFLDGLRLKPFRDQVTFSESAVSDWLEIMDRDRGNQRALVLSAGMYPQFPAMNYADFEMAMPFLTMWPLRGLYEQCRPGEQGYRPLDRQSAPEKFVFTEVVEGFVEEKPELLVVDKGDDVVDCSGKAFEYLPYFMRDVRFAREFRNYRPLASLGQFTFYERMARAVSTRPSTPIEPRAKSQSSRPQVLQKR